MPNDMKEEPTILRMECKTLNDHEIGRRAITHDGITHATGEQLCLRCNKTLDSLLHEAEARGRKETFKHGQGTFEHGYKEGKKSAMKELAEKIEGMKKNVKLEFDVGSEFSTPRIIRENGYNWALRDVATLLKEEEEKQ